MNLARLVLRSLMRHPRRAILTTLTFVVGAFIFNMLLAVPSSMDAILRNMSDAMRLYSYNADGRYLGLPARYCRDIEQLPHVVGCMTLTSMRSTYRNTHEIIAALAVDVDKLGLLYPDYELSTQVLAQYFATERTAAIVGRNLMRKYHWKLGDTVTLRAESNRLDLRFKIVGEIPARNYPNFFIFRRDYYVESEKALGIPEEKRPPSLLVTRVDRVENLPVVTHEIDQAFHNSDYETATMTESEAAAGMLSTVGNIRGIIYAVFVVLLMTVFLIAANSMAMAVREHVRDVAILRTLGFHQGYLAAMLLSECGLIALIGGLIGTGLATWLFRNTSTLGAVLGYMGYLVMSPVAALVAIIAALAIGLLSALAPVVSALRGTPVEMLHRTV